MLILTCWFSDSAIVGPAVNRLQSALPSKQSNHFNGNINRNWWIFYLISCHGHGSTRFPKKMNCSHWIVDLPNANRWDFNSAHSFSPKKSKCSKNECVIWHLSFCAKMSTIYEESYMLNIEVRFETRTFTLPVFLVHNDNNFVYMYLAWWRKKKSIV